MAALWSSSFEMVRIVNHEYGQTKSLAVQVETICFVSSGRTGTKQMFDPRVAETKITKRDLASGDRRPVWSVATTAVRICYRFTTSLSVFVLFFFSFGNSARRSLVLSGRRALCVISGTDFCRLGRPAKDRAPPPSRSLSCRPTSWHGVAKQSRKRVATQGRRGWSVKNSRSDRVPGIWRPFSDDTGP